MAELDRTLTKGARRIAQARFVWALVTALVAATFVLIAWRIAEKAFAAPAPDWSIAWGVGLGGALLGSVVWVWMTRPDRESVARRLDEALGLQATLATAAWARSQTASQGDAWQAATVDEGERAAKRTDVRSAIPVTVPRYWSLPVLLAALTLAGGWIPQQNVLALFGGDDDDQQIAVAEREKEIIEIQQAFEEARNDLDAALSEVNDDALQELLEQQDQIAEPRTPEELRAAEMRRLTAVRDRLEELENKAKAEADALKDLTSRIEAPEGLSPVSEMANALRRGDFSEAVKQLEALKEQLESGELSEEQKQALQQQLQQLANQLQQAAQKNQEAMQNLAKQAGLPPSLANNPQALQQAIQNSQNLTQQQKQQLQQQLQNMQKAAGQCQNCAGGMSQLAQSLGQQGMGGAMQNLQGQLSQMEMMEMQLQNLQAAKGQCSGAMAGLGQGGGKGANQLPLWAQKQRLVQGGGGTGAGNSGRGGTEEGTNNSEDTLVDAKKAQTVVNPSGPIVGSMVVEGGEQIRGESVAQFREVAKASGQAAADAIDEARVPKEYEDVVKGYFGGLEKEAQNAEPAQPAPTPNDDD